MVCPQGQRSYHLELTIVKGGPLEGRSQLMTCGPGTGMVMGF